MADERYNEDLCDCDKPEVVDDLSCSKCGLLLPQCSTCCDDGFIEVGPICSMPPSNCCGGCFVNRPCPDCNPLADGDDEPFVADDLMDLGGDA